MTTPTLEAFKINGVTPFWSAGDAHDECLAQAHAITLCLSAAHDSSEDGNDTFDTLTHTLKARALNGVATLLAMAQHQADEALASRTNRSEMPPAEDSRDWAMLTFAYELATRRLDEHPIDRSECGSPENIAHETETARLADVRAEAFDALMLAPAPNRKALAYKLAAWRDMVGGDAWHSGDKIAQRLADDAARLADDAARLEA